MKVVVCAVGRVREGTPAGTLLTTCGAVARCFSGDDSGGIHEHNVLASVQCNTYRTHKNAVWVFLCTCIDSLSRTFIERVRFRLKIFLPEKTQ